MSLVDYNTTIIYYNIINDNIMKLKRKIIRVGNSIGISIPYKTAEEHGLKIGDVLVGAMKKDE